MAKTSGLIVAIGMSVAFAFFYYVQYFQWCSCFNELGRCYDAQTGMVFLEQSGIIWLACTIISLCSVVYLLLLKRR